MNLDEDDEALRDLLEGSQVSPRPCCASTWFRASKQQSLANKNASGTRHTCCFEVTVVQIQASQARNDGV